MYHGEWNYNFPYVACTEDEKDFCMSMSFVDFTWFKEIST